MCSTHGVQHPLSLQPHQLHLPFRQLFPRSRAMPGVLQTCPRHRRIRCSSLAAMLPHQVGVANVRFLRNGQTVALLLLTHWMFSTMLTTLILLLVLFDTDKLLLTGANLSLHPRRPVHLPCLRRLAVHPPLPNALWVRRHLANVLHLLRLLRGHLLTC